MSVFHKLYLGNDYGFSELKKACIDYMSKNNVMVTDTNNNELTISSEGFTMSIKEGGNSVIFRSEDYRLSLKYDFYIDINSSYTNWAVELMEFVGKILKSHNSDFVLEANSDFPYIMRKKEDGIVIVDDTKLGDFPFECLGIEYKKEKLEQV
jgi:hypothetical protein